MTTGSDLIHKPHC